MTLLARRCGIRESLPVSLAAEDGWSDMVYDDLLCDGTLRKGLRLIPGVRGGKHEPVLAKHVRER